MKQVPSKVPETASSSARDDAIEHDEREALEELLQRLPKAEAEVIALAFFGELTHIEIAEQLDLSEDRVKGRMRLGMKRLRREMDAAG